MKTTLWDGTLQVYRAKRVHQRQISWKLQSESMVGDDVSQGCSRRRRPIRRTFGTKPDRGCHERRIERSTRIHDRRLDLYKACGIRGAWLSTANTAIITSPKNQEPEALRLWVWVQPPRALPVYQVPDIRKIHGVAYSFNASILNAPWDSSSNRLTSPTVGQSCSQE